MRNNHNNAQFAGEAGDGRLAFRPRQPSLALQRAREFVRARRLFPPQKGLDDFDPLLAQVLAWDGAADAALTTLGLDNYPDHEGSRQQESPPLRPTSHTSVTPRLTATRSSG